MRPERGTTPDSSTAGTGEEGSPSRVIALCHHARTEADVHYDLFLGPEGPFEAEERILEAWRLEVDPRLLNTGDSLPLTPIGRHRGLYARLPCARTLDRGRGRVTPMATGSAVVSGEPGGHRILNVVWNDGAQECYRIESTETGRPRLHRHAPSS